MPRRRDDPLDLVELVANETSPRETDPDELTQYLRMRYGIRDIKVNMVKEADDE